MYKILFICKYEYDIGDDKGNGYVNRERTLCRQLDSIKSAKALYKTCIKKIQDIIDSRNNLIEYVHVNGEGNALTVYMRYLDGKTYRMMHLAIDY